MGADDPRGDETAPTAQSFGAAARLRRPSDAQIRAAVDATPTVEDQGPGIEAPAYLRSEAGRVSGTVGKEGAASREPGFTDTPSSDPTQINEPAAAARAQRRGALVLVGAVALAAAAAVVAVLALR